MGLKNDSTVSDLIALFNAGTIKYKDIQIAYDCSRDLIQSRLKGIGLTWDNTARQMVGTATEEDLNVQLATLFKRQRNKPTKVPTKQRSNVTKRHAKEEIELTKQEAAPTIEPTNEPTLIKVDIIETKHEPTYFDLVPRKERTHEPTKQQTNEPTIIRKRASFDIDVELMRELKIQAIVNDRNVYEIVEGAIRKAVEELKRDL